MKFFSMQLNEILKVALIAAFSIRIANILNFSRNYRVLYRAGPSMVAIIFMMGTKYEFNDDQNKDQI